jgi:hypothetical protein
VSRFAIDTSTEYLFGHDFRTLSAGLPYPASSPLSNSPGFSNHSSNTFSDAFTSGQHYSIARVWKGANWPLVEFWKDEVKPFRKIVDEFIEPVLQDALAKHARIEGKPSVERERTGGDEESLLTHLLSHMQGFRIVYIETL